MNNAISAVNNHKGPATASLPLPDGRTVMRPEVVATVVGLAAREVPGVFGLVPFGAGEAIVNLAHSLSGSDKRDLGVRVELGEVECAIDVRVAVEYGAAIPRVCEQLRAAVERRVGETTGYEVREINIEVVDLQMPQADPAPASGTRALR